MRAAGEMARCPECSGSMVYKTGRSTVRYKNHSASVALLGYWCTNCNEAVFDGKALAKKEKAFFDLRAKIERVLSPQQVAAIRKQLHLSQRRAGELLGGGPRAFQKYESGEQAVSTPMTLLLLLLSKDPSRIKELTSREEQHAA